MDDIVQQAMAKWPHVPDCYGWLGLDARGNWYMRDEKTQLLGHFNAKVPGCKGAELRHEKLVEFIGRNYAADSCGRWFFQNGPQRVFVELQATPLIWRLQPDSTVHDHIGRLAQVESCWLDEFGLLYLNCDLGFGMLHSQDMLQAAQLLEQGTWQAQDALCAQLPQQFGYVTSPQTHQKS